MQKSLTNLQGWNHIVKMDIRDRTYDLLSLFEVSILGITKYG